MKVTKMANDEERSGFRTGDLLQIVDNDESYTLYKNIEYDGYHDYDVSGALCMCLGVTQDDNDEQVVLVFVASDDYVRTGYIESDLVVKLDGQ